MLKKRAKLCYYFSLCGDSKFTLVAFPKDESIYSILLEHDKSIGVYKTFELDTDSYEELNSIISDRYITYKSKTHRHSRMNYLDERLLVEDLNSKVEFVPEFNDIREFRIAIRM